MGHHNEVLQVYPMLIVPVGLHVDTHSTPLISYWASTSHQQIFCKVFKTPQTPNTAELRKYLSTVSQKSKANLPGAFQVVESNTVSTWNFSVTLICLSFPQNTHTAVILFLVPYGDGIKQAKFAAVPHTLLLVLCHSSLRTFKTRHLPAHYSHHKHVWPRN